GALRVTGAGRAGTGAILDRVADARRRAAGHARAREGIGRAGRARAGAVLGHVADARPRAAGYAGAREGVGRAVRARAGAVLGLVAGVGRRAARYARAHEGIGRAAGARAGAVFGHVALAGGGTAGEDARQDHVRGTGRVHTVAQLVGVAHVTGARAAHRPGVPGGMLAGGAGAVAFVDRARLTVGGAGGAGRRPRVG